MRGSINSALREEGAVFRLVSDATFMQHMESGQWALSDLSACPQNTEFILLTSSALSSWRLLLISSREDRGRELWLSPSVRRYLAREVIQMQEMRALIPEYLICTSAFAVFWDGPDLIASLNYPERLWILLSWRWGSLSHGEGWKLDTIYVVGDCKIFTHWP